MKKATVQQIFSVLDEGLQQTPYLIPGHIALSNKNNNLLFIKKEDKYLVEEVYLPDRSISYYELNKQELQNFLENLKGYK